VKRPANLVLRVFFLDCILPWIHAEFRAGCVCVHTSIQRSPMHSLPPCPVLLDTTQTPSMDTVADVTVRR